MHQLTTIAVFRVVICMWKDISLILDECKDEVCKFKTN